MTCYNLTVCGFTASINKGISYFFERVLHYHYFTTCNQKILHELTTFFQFISDIVFHLTLLFFVRVNLHYVAHFYVAIHFHGSLLSIMVTVNSISMIKQLFLRFRAKLSVKWVPVYRYDLLLNYKL